MVRPMFLNEKTSRIQDESPEITMEEIEKIKEIEVLPEKEFYAPHDILEVSDTDHLAEVSHLVFRWLNPELRARNGMQGWQWVKGELAAYVRKHDIVREAVGGGSGTSLITTGDLVLAFMPKHLYQARKEYIRTKTRQDFESVQNQDLAKSEGAAMSQKVRQEVESDMDIHRTYGGVEVQEE